MYILKSTKLLNTEIYSHCKFITHCLVTCVASASHCLISFSLRVWLTILTFDLLRGSAEYVTTPSDTA